MVHYCTPRFGEAIWNALNSPRTARTPPNPATQLPFLFLLLFLFLLDTHCIYFFPDKLFKQMAASDINTLISTFA